MGFQMKLCQTVVRSTREFKNFAKEYGLNHVTTRPYHPIVKLSLLLWKQRRSSKTPQRPEVTLTGHCWLIVTPHRKDFSLLCHCVPPQRKRLSSNQQKDNNTLK